jgi:hypothetical protein
MARNREFDDALDELKMLHDAKNHDYATAENPYKNLEGVSKIGIEPWRGIVIRLMDKFERVQQYCVNGELAIKSEGMEDTFKDIAVYSTLAMILFRKDQDKHQEIEDTERLRETLQAREDRKEEERLANDKKCFLSAIDKLEAERRARDN